MTNDDYRCRNCAAPANHTVIDLGEQPSANRLLSKDDLERIQAGTEEPRAPLIVNFCPSCYLVQVTDTAGPEQLFHSDYVYFSSYSGSWAAHAERYVDMAIDRFQLNDQSFVVEVASNDGYLLRHMVTHGIPCLGIDPAKNAADAAREKGVETMVTFFDRTSAAEIIAGRGQADLIAGNNVFAHVPDTDGFVAALAMLLKPEGSVTLEFPHLARMVDQTQFDTIYDEHYSYLSLRFVMGVMAKHGLEVYDVERLPTHGGSLRVYTRHVGADTGPVRDAVADVLQEEQELKLFDPATYTAFRARAEKIRDDFCRTIQEEKAAGRRIAAFGAAAKGNTFLNYCGIGADSIDFVVDDTPAKQGMFLPGSHIPVVAEKTLHLEKPDLVVILAWNFATELKKRLAPITAWNGRVLTAIPDVVIEPP